MSDPKAPLVHSIRENVPGVATANADDAINIAKAPYAGTVSAVSYAPEAAMAQGDGTNNRVFSLINKGQAGAGTTVIATFSTQTAAFAADDERALTLSGTPANLVVAAGDVLEWSSDANGTGVVDPGGLVSVDISRS